MKDTIFENEIPGTFQQMPVYNDAIEKHRFDCRYMGFIDADEFIFLKTGQTLPNFLDDHFAHDSHIAGLGINWRMFGSSGKQKYDPADVIERFTRRAPDDHKSHQVIKSIVNPRRVVQLTISHSAIYLLSSLCDDEKHVSVTVFYSYENSTELIQCNHYFTKSIEEYAQKCSRGRSDCGNSRNESAALRSEFYEVEDFGLRDFWRELKTQPFPKIKDHSPQKILNNIRTMLSTISNKTSVENFLTCLNLIQRSPLINPTEKIYLERFLLNQLKTSLFENEIEPWNCMLLLIMTPQFLSMHLDEANEILRIIQRMIPQILHVAESETRHELRFFTKQIKIILDSVL